MKATIPANEAQRLAALHRYQILDTLPETSYDDITFLASQICGTPVAAVSLIDDHRQWFKSSIGFGFSELPRDLAVCSHTILQDDLLVIPDARADERFADNPLVTDAPWLRFYAGAPLITPGGEAVGTVCVLDHEKRTLTAEQGTTLRALARQVMAQLELRRVVAEQARYQQVLEQTQEALERSNAQLALQSITDDVTGFHNTRFLHQYLDRHLLEAQRSGIPLSLLFFDMDHFKRLVDSYGHLLGAKALKEVAEVVDRQLGALDRVVRYGGDEFVVILPDHGRQGATRIAERLRDSIASTHFLSDEGLALRLTASFGLAVFPEDAPSKKGLLLAADECLFQSKSGGKNRITGPLRAIKPHPAPEPRARLHLFPA